MSINCLKRSLLIVKQDVEKEIERMNEITKNVQETVATDAEQQG